MNDKYGSEEWKVETLQEIRFEVMRIRSEVERFHNSTFLYKFVLSNLIAGLALVIAILK